MNPLTPHFRTHSHSYIHTQVHIPPVKIVHVLTIRLVQFVDVYNFFFLRFVVCCGFVLVAPGCFPICFLAFFVFFRATEMSGCLSCTSLKPLSVSISSTVASSSLELPSARAAVDLETPETKLNGCRIKPDLERSRLMAEEFG